MQQSLHWCSGGPAKSSFVFVCFSCASPAPDSSQKDELTLILPPMKQRAIQKICIFNGHARKVLAFFPF